MLPLLIPKKYANRTEDMIKWFAGVIASNSVYGVTGTNTDQQSDNEMRVMVSKLINYQLAKDPKFSEQRIFDHIQAMLKAGDKITWNNIAEWIEIYGDPRARLIGYPFKL